MIQMQVSEQDVLYFQFIVGDVFQDHLPFSIPHHTWVNDDSMMRNLVPQDIHILAKWIDGQHYRIHSGRYSTFLVLKKSSLK